MSAEVQMYGCSGLTNRELKRRKEDVAGAVEVFVEEFFLPALSTHPRDGEAEPKASSPSSGVLAKTREIFAWRLWPRVRPLRL